MDGSLSYNLYDMQTFNPVTKVGINTNVIRHTDMPDQLAQVHIIANASDSNVPNAEFPYRRIQLGGTIHGSSQANLDTRVDALKSHMALRDKNLDIGYAGGVRRYKVMKYNAISIDRRNRALYATFRVEFLCKPFGYEVNSENLWPEKTGVTTNTFTETPSIQGTAPLQHPIFTVTINSLSGPGDFILLQNTVTLQTILVIDQNLAAADILVIDCDQRTITRNGEDIDYLGSFPEFEPGIASVTYLDSFTTRNVDVAATYTRKYL